MLICRKSEKMPNCVDYVGDRSSKRLFSLRFFRQVRVSKTASSSRITHKILKLLGNSAPCPRKSGLAAAKGRHELHDRKCLVAAEQDLNPLHFGVVLRDRCGRECLLVLVEGIARRLLKAGAKRRASVELDPTLVVERLQVLGTGDGRRGKARCNHGQYGKPFRHLDPLRSRQKRLFVPIQSTIVPNFAKRPIR